MTLRNEVIDFREAIKARGLAPNERPLILRDPKDPRRPLQLQRYQWEFATSPSFATYFAGGWFSGKSYALLQWLALRAFMNPEGTGGMVVLPTYKLMAEFLSQYLIPSFGYDEGGMIVGMNSNEGVLHLRGNRRLLFRSAHEPKRIEASDLCYVGADEVGLMKSEVFVRMVARTRDDRAVLPFLGFTGVPIYGWLKDEFDDRSDMQRRIIRATSYDNKRAGKEAITNLLDACPARMRPCYIEGKFVAPGNLVYTDFNLKKHVIDWKFDHYVKPERGARRRSTFVLAVDPGARSPHVLFIQVVPPGVRLPNGILTEKHVAIVWFELFPGGAEEDGVRVDDLCAMIREINCPLEVCYMDPAGDQIESTSGETVAAMFADKLDLDIEWETDPDLRSIVNSVELVQYALRPESGHPRLFFARSLLENTSPRAVLNAIQRYAYPKDVEGKPLAGKPHKDGITDHAMDALRYFFINREEFIPDIWRNRITMFRAA